MILMRDSRFGNCRTIGRIEISRALQRILQRDHHGSPGTRRGIRLCRRGGDSGPSLLTCCTHRHQDQTDSHGCRLHPPSLLLLFMRAQAQDYCRVSPVGCGYAAAKSLSKPSRTSESVTCRLSFVTYAAYPIAATMRIGKSRCISLEAPNPWPSYERPIQTGHTFLIVGRSLSGTGRSDHGEHQLE